MERPSSVPAGLHLPRPPSPFMNRGNAVGKEETSKFAPPQLMADLKKANFSLKLKIYYLETTLSKVSGTEQFDVLTENVQLKVEKENLAKELSTNKELLIKASSVVDSLSSNQGNQQKEDPRLAEENEELQKLINNLENELLTARQDSEEKSVELEHVHADCMLLEDQLLLKNEALQEKEEKGADVNEDLEALQAQLAAQEHLYQTETDDMKKELEDVREVMIKTHEENIGHRLTLAEKEESIKDLTDQLSLCPHGTCCHGDKGGDESSEAGDSRSSLLEALSNFTSTNARLEEELNSMENTNTELKNMINTLNNEREALLEQLGDRDELQQKLRDYEMDMEQLRQEMHEAAILRGNIEETEQQRQEDEHIAKSLKQNVEKLSKENAECSKENTLLQQDNEMFREKVQDLNKEICELKEEARGLRKTSDIVNESKVNELNEEILSLKQSLSDANEDLKYCKEDMKTLEGDYERTTEELELLEEELKEGEVRRVTLTDELDELKEELLKIKSQGHEEKTRLKHEKSKAQQELADYRNQVSELINEREKMDKNLKQLNTDKGKALFEVKKLESDMEKLRKSNQNIEGEIERLKEEEKKRIAEKDSNMGALSARKSYMEDRVKELQDTKRSLEDSVLSLKDQLSTTPLPGNLYDNVIYENIDNIDPDTGEDEGDKLKDTIISEIKSERDHHRQERKDLENELRRIHEMIHDLIRQLHRYNNDTHNPLQLAMHDEDFLVESLKDAIELVVNALIGSRDRQVSNTSSLQTTSGVISCSDNDVTDLHRRYDRPEDLAALQRENSLLHSNLLESRELIAALRKEMKDLLEKLNSTNSEDRHVRDMLVQINNLISTSLLQSPEKPSNGYSLANSHDQHEYSNVDINGTDMASDHRMTAQRLKIKESRLSELEGKLKQSVQELSNTECKLTATQSKLAVAEHKIQGLEQRLHKQKSRPSDTSSSLLLNQKMDSLQQQLQSTEGLLREKSKLIRDKNEVIDSLLDEKRSRSRCEDCAKPRYGAADDVTHNATHNLTHNTTHTSTHNHSYGNAYNSTTYSPRSYSPHNLTPSTMQVSDYILLCASNWLDELPELMRALRNAVHNSLIDCKSVQTRVNERKATWAMTEVSRLSTRLDAVYRLLQHVENLSCQQPPSRLMHSLQHDVQSKDHEIKSLNDKLLKRSKDVQKLRSRVEEQDKQRIKQKMFKNNLAGLNPSILSKVIDTETVLREAHKSLEKRMIAKENHYS
ncbi:putative uncharacterized protein MYH16 isoform X3 [Bolinopsis microptera]|uniref:putative uncharacterized protein MYH16 isoform X3 n=1 Tax=Bolinopsis microptera TaxID=2820187 RepID=UPI0030796F00